MKERERGGRGGGEGGGERERERVSDGKIGLIKGSISVRR